MAAAILYKYDGLDFVICNFASRVILLLFILCAAFSLPPSTAVDGLKNLALLLDFEMDDGPLSTVAVKMLLFAKINKICSLCLASIFSNNRYSVRKRGF